MTTILRQQATSASDSSTPVVPAAQQLRRSVDGSADLVHEQTQPAPANQSDASGESTFTSGNRLPAAPAPAPHPSSSQLQPGVEFAGRSHSDLVLIHSGWPVKQYFPEYSEQKPVLQRLVKSETNGKGAHSAQHATGAFESTSMGGGNLSLGDRKAADSLASVAASPALTWMAAEDIWNKNIAGTATFSTSKRSENKPPKSKGGLKGTIRVTQHRKSDSTIIPINGKVQSPVAAAAAADARYPKQTARESRRPLSTVDFFSVPAGVHSTEQQGPTRIQNAGWERCIALPMDGLDGLDEAPSNARALRRHQLPPKDTRHLL